jgi:hypothetical protein
MTDSKLKVKHFYINGQYPSLKELIWLNHFDEANPHITVKNFKTPESGKLKGRINLVCFGYRLTTREAISLLREEGLRPLTLCEGLFLAYKRPDIQRNITIVLAGSIGSHPDGELRIARLDGSAKTRELNLGWYAHDQLDSYGYFGWPETCYFAGIKK